MRKRNKILAVVFVAVIVTVYCVYSLLPEKADTDEVQSDKGSYTNYIDDPQEDSEADELYFYSK